MFALKSRVVFKPLENEGIIIDVNTGRYLSLNVSASTMLAALIDHRDVGKAAEALVNVFDVDNRTLRQDLEDLVSQLQELDLALKGGTP